MSGAGTADILASVLEACERTPDAPAVTLGRRSLSFGTIRHRVLDIAAGLKDRGMLPGDRMLFSVRPGPASICLALGVMAAGGTVVFADPGAGESMFRARSALAAPRWVAAESLLFAASAGPGRRLARRRGLELPDYRTLVPDARYLYSGRWLPGVPRGATALHQLRGTHRAVAAQSESEALIIFTSGTTSDPKAVVHSRRSLGAGLGDFANRVGFTAGERVVTDQLMIGIPALISGAHWILPKVGADPGAAPSRYRALLDQADVLFAVPSLLDALLRLPASTGSSPRAIIVGGAPVLVPLIERVHERFPESRIHAIYGMTEALPVAIADGEAKLAFTGTGDWVGQVVPSVDARIVEGELAVSGPGLALGYLGRQPIRELRTGDLARLENGALVLEGRGKDMFIRGTTNVYPGLYEPAIAALPGVEQTAMVGVADDIGDDRIVLVVVPAADFSESRLRAMLPTVVDAAVLPDAIILRDALPLSGRSGKLDRAALADEISRSWAGSAGSTP